MSKIREVLYEENIEYLEECINSENFFETGDKADIFYPNAVQCMLSLYGERYDSINHKSAEELQTLSIWKEIAKIMQESFFNFKANQIRWKFSTLRKQYFDIKSIEDIEDFEYFDYFHHIYNDEYVETILNGGDKQALSLCHRQAYPDEVLMNIEQNRSPDVCNYQCINQITQKARTNGIDVSEHYLKTIEESDNVECEHFNHKIPKKQQNAYNLSLNSFRNIKAASNDCKYLPNKIPKSEKRCFPEMESEEQQQPVLKRQKPIQTSAIKANSISPMPVTANNFTLFDLNIEQERRHQEAMQLLRETIKLHETSIDLQKEILQALKARS